MDLADKTVLVTGGTSGIGYQLVRQLSERGATTVVLARSITKLEEMAETLANVYVYPCDLSKRTDVEQTWQAVADAHPDLSILINNAGVQLTPTFIDDDFDFDGIDFEVTTNLTAPLWLTALFLTDRRQGWIVNVSSGLAFFPKTPSLVYSACKAALHSASQCLRYQLAGTDVGVSEVLLPLVDTPMTEGRGADKLSPQDAAAAILDGVAAERAEIYVGKARMLPVLLRLAPGLVKRILKRS